jgi:hypothetical protein
MVGRSDCGGFTSGSRHGGGSGGIDAMQNTFIIAVLVCLLIVGQTNADEINVENDTVQFDAEVKKDTQARTCNLMTMIVDKARPEVVNFRIIHALSPQAIFLGFSLDVGDMRYQNGLPAGLDHAVLARGDVSTGSFSSEGRMYGGPTPDGGILKSTMDQETATNLWLGVLSGHFSLHLLRATPGAQPRTYQIATPPSRDALGKYLACSLEIQDVALGQPRSPDAYAKIRDGGPGITEPKKMPITPDHPYASVLPPVSEEGPLVGKR